MNGNYLAAVYDFRSKQDYIYRTNRVQEIMGASELIASAYRSAIAAYPGAHMSLDAQFELSEFDASSIQGTVLYEGGGNLVLLFKSKEAFLAFNNHFSLWLIDNAPGLTPICGSAEIDVNGKFREEITKVFADLGRYKRLAPPLLNDTVLPVTQIDRRISQPVVYKGERFGAPESLSAESVKKREVYRARIQSGENREAVLSRNFDDIVSEKGTESLLAILHADGNGMGERVKDAISKNILFEEGVNKQRDLTREINDALVTGPMEAIMEYLTQLQRTAPEVKKPAMRRVISSGDDVTIVCNARHAMKIAELYFANIGEGYSACMGIAVFHSHAPFSAVYDIAEQCCESGKKRMKSDGAANACYLDACFCHSAITGDLDHLRTQISSVRTNMPYRYSEGTDAFQALGNELGKIKRSNVKSLRDAAFRSQADFEMELMRVKSNCAGFAVRATDRVMLCDVCTFYDLWFGGEVNG